MMAQGGRLIVMAMVGCAAGIFLLGGLYPASCYETENVFLIVIDGVRNTEAFDDTTHANVPHMWNDLRPLGTIYSNFYNTGTTITTGAHLTMLSGVRSGLPHCVARGDDPLAFECYRKELGIPQEEVWLFDNNPDGFDGVDYSTHPAYGEEYASSSYHAYPRSDFHVARALAQVMDQYHPSLVLVNLFEVDHIGHQENWDGYLEAIRRADAIVYHIWKKIQADTTFNPAFTDTTYRDKTTLIVTTDHGRRDEMHGGFKNHSLRDRGCRDLMFLAVGPDIKADTVIETRGDQIDIGPTIAELLEFSLPLAQGRVLDEMLIVPPGKDHGNGEVTRRAVSSGWHPGPDRSLMDDVRVTNTDAMSRDPSIAASDEGLHLVWAERDTGLVSDGWDIRYALSTDAGSTWVEEDAPFIREGEDTPHTPDIAADRLLGAFAVSTAYTFRPDKPGADSTFVWGVVGRARYESGGWSPTVVPTEPELMMIHGEPAVAVSGEQIEVLSAASYFQMAAASRESLGVGWRRRRVQTWGGRLRECPEMAMADSAVHALFVARSPEHGVPWYARRTAATATVDTFLTNGEGLIHGAGLAVAGDRVIAVWGDDRQGHWEVYWRRSTDSGVTWPEQAASLSESGVGAWLPDVEASGDTIWVVWEDYRDGNAEIYAKQSTDAGLTWSEDTRVTSSSGFSVHPRVTHRDGDAYVVWQDDCDGNWEIYSARIEFPQGDRLLR